jgi:hypothetical protein
VLAASLMMLVAWAVFITTYRPVSAPVRPAVMVDP